MQIDVVELSNLQRDYPELTFGFRILQARSCPTESELLSQLFPAFLVSPERGVDNFTVLVQIFVNRYGTICR